jgi:methylmalonyl-CoA mutase
MSELPLASEFPAATHDDWRKLLDGTLKGAPFEKLIAKTYDGIAIQPLYERAAGAKPVTGRRGGAPWAVIQRIDLPDAAEANRQALNDLENGATGIRLVFAASAGDHGFHLTADKASLERTLDNIWLDGATIELDVSPLCENVPEMLAGIAKERGGAPASMAIHFGCDPLGAMALHGRSPSGWDALAPRFAAKASALRDAGFGGSVATADGRIVHASGGSEAQELAFVLAAAVAYLRALEAHGMALDAAYRAISFRLAADADQFLTVAKFRALRKLWARIAAAASIAAAPAYVSAETAWRMMTRRDPHVNFLRTTLAVAAAGFGGADAISVLPHTAALGLADGFARRIARNTQTILIEESNLHRVADPAAGAGGIEALTDELCASAWQLFQEIEQQGGLAAMLKTGSFQKRVGETRSKRLRNIALRKDPLTGTSEFPNLGEAKENVSGTAPRHAALPYPPIAEPLAPIRTAQAFEALRDRAEALPVRPRIFLVNLGSPADYTARATFARNLFEAGGIEAVPSDSLGSPESAATAFAASAAKLACLCSSDVIYGAQAEAVARSLKKVGAFVWLAGRPGEREAALKAAGVDGFVYAGCDVIAALEQAHDQL